jgi:hypothetical protein
MSTTKAGEGHAEAVADGGAVLDAAQLEQFHLASEPLVVEGERGEGVGAAGEDDHADAVARALRDEGLDDGFDGLQAVDALAVALVILGQHRAGEVDREHQVIALLFHLAPVLDDLRAGEGQREVGIIDGRCQAAANGTTSTGAPRRPRTHASSGNASRARSHQGEWSV